MKSYRLALKFTGLLGTLTDRPAEVTDCIVTFPTQSVSHHVQSGLPYLGQARYLKQTGLFHSRTNQEV